MLSLGCSSEDLSTLVDSDGFLAWNTGSVTSGRSNGIGYRPRPVSTSRGQPKRSDSFDTDNSDLSNLIESKYGDSCNSSQSNLVDSNGFLDWDSRVKDKHTIAQCNQEVPASRLHESWRIEDFEGPSDTNDLTKAERSGSGNNILSVTEKMRRLSSKVTEGLSTRRHSVYSNNTDTTSTDAIKTNDIKHILLKGHSSEEGALDRCKAKRNDDDTGPLHNSAFKFLFNGRKSSDKLPSSDPNRRPSGLVKEPSFYSRPPIRINREDGIDIGELRKELNQAGNNNEGIVKSGFNMGFF